MAVLGLRFCARAFSSCGERGPLFIAVRGPLTIAASLVAEQRLQTLRLSSCGSRAQLPRSMWDPPRPGLEPVSPALAGRLPTTAPPGKPPADILIGIPLYVIHCFSLAAFKNSLFIFNFCHFNYDMSLCGPLGFILFGILCILYLDFCFLFRLENFSAMISSNTFSTPLSLSLLLLGTL